MARYTLCLAPRDMLDLCEWIEHTPDIDMTGEALEKVRAQALDAIVHESAIKASGLRLGARNTIISMEVTIEGEDEHILYAMMRWKSLRLSDEMREALDQASKLAKPFTVTKKGTAAFATVP